MARGATWSVGAAVLGAAMIAAAPPAQGNGGPFIVKHPKGDPAAKGVLARLDPSLMPARERRLEVVKEDLSILLGRNTFGRVKGPPLASVTALYTIKNPTKAAVTMDFGFPILRGIYVPPYSMSPTPSVFVRVDGKYVRTRVISNSIIYGVIRQRARRALEVGIAADATLARLVKAARAAVKSKAQRSLDRSPVRAQQKAAAPPAFCPAAAAARKALATHLSGKLKWTKRQAALMVEYASVDLGRVSYPADGSHYWPGDAQLSKLQYSNMGPLAAIGEQRSTQMLALLAGRFDPKVVAAYQSIFKAWGGSVRERSVDLATGKVRPREIAGKGRRAPTVYARVAYFKGHAKMTLAERSSCKRALKNLPVVFTFAPMNLLYYQVKFPAGATRKVAVSYQQHAYEDTRGRASFQLAYVLHPASLWRRFGPINLTIYAPGRVPLRSSVPCVRGKKVISKLSGTATLYPYRRNKGDPGLTACKATLDQPAQKRGELFVGLDAAQWQRVWKQNKARVGQRQGRGL